MTCVLVPESMTAIPLLTSIPPKMTRFNAANTDVGAAYQGMCLESWTSSGFAPHSLNSSHEQLPEALSNKINVIAVSPDAREETGRPLVFLEDFLKIGAEHANPVVAITNADIVLEFDLNLREQVTALKPGQFLAAHRTDVDDSRQRANPEIYDKGFDFFAFHATDLRRMLATGIPGFVFGMPWWDYYLPLAALISGIEVKTLSASKIVHLRHDNRWNAAAGEHFGQLFLREMSKAREHPRPGFSTPGDFDEFFDRLENPPPLTVRESASVWVKRALFRKRYTATDHALARASNTTRRFLLQSINGKNENHDIL